jgi:hypothetical protein
MPQVVQCASWRRGVLPSLLVAALVILVGAEPARACGFKVPGRAAKVKRSYVGQPAAGPVSILLIGTEIDASLDSALRQRGHRVIRVPDRKTLSRELQSGSHAILIAPLAEVKAIGGTKKVRLVIPVVREEPPAGSPQFAFVLRGGERPAQQASVVDRAIGSLK